MKKIILLLIISLFTFSCDYFRLMPYKEWLKQTDNDEIDIYICGYYDYDNACYWRIGENNPIDLVNGTNNGRAQDIHIYRDDIYITGSYNGHQGVEYGNACYWKNDEIIPLEALASTDSFSNSIFISNGNICICGIIDYTLGIGFTKRACYWKNGKLTILSSSESIARNIYVVDNDIYISGYINTGYERPCYWINGNLEYLPVPSGTIFATAFNLYSNRNSLYICGYYSDGTTYDVCYWKNKDRIDIANSNVFCGAYAINMNGNDIEIYYILNESGNYFAYYWKNNTTIVLPFSGVNSGVAKCFKFNGDTYVCGQDTGKAVWWKNNHLQNTLLGASDDGANGICVTYKYLMDR